MAIRPSVAIAITAALAIDTIARRPLIFPNFQLPIGSDRRFPHFRQKNRRPKYKPGRR